MPTTTWKCEVCGHVHNGAEPPGSCPVCGVPGESFAPLEVGPPAGQDTIEAWRCAICDHRMDGAAPPERCPVCGATREHFEPVVAAEAAVGSAQVGQVVILGSGIAGVTAAEHARTANPEADVVLVGQEPPPPYYRLNLTRYLAGEVGAEELELHEPDWFAERRIELVTGEVTGIERDASMVRLRDGKMLPYDRLVLANGSHPFVPPVPGSNLDGVTTLRTIPDFDALTERLADGARCVVIGGGLLGLETAGALKQRGVAVTVIEGYGWLLPRQLPEAAGRLLIELLEQQGIPIVTAARTAAIEGEGRVSGVRLEDGTTLPAEVVVLCTGVRPNSYLARQAGLDCESGVLVDDEMCSSDAQIYAAGDVAEHRGVVYGIWPASYAQGAVAGVNAAGGAWTFTGLPPSNRIKVLDVELFSIGVFNPSDASFLVCEQREADRYERVVCRDGRVVGAVLFGDVSLAGRIKDAVEGQRHVRELPDLVERFPGLAAYGG